MALPYDTEALSSTSQPWVLVGVDELIDQARLPHPGLADEATTWPWPAPARPGPAAGPRAPVCRPTKRVSPRPPRPASAAGCALGPDQLKDLHRLRQPLDRHRPQRVDLDQALDQPQRRGGEQDAARRGQLLHARRQVRGLPHGRVVHVQVVADRPHHHLAGVEPDADLHREPVGAAHLLGIAAHRRLHGQGGIAGPHGMVLMGQRRPNSAMMPSPMTWFTVPS